MCGAVIGFEHLSTAQLMTPALVATANKILPMASPLLHR